MDRHGGGGKTIIRGRIGRGYDSTHGIHIFDMNRCVSRSIHRDSMSHRIGICCGGGTCIS
jgi:hypothetical protein